ncbi:putative secreted lipase-like protein 3 [Colletotrichum chlorophyti]|uniref:Putative secreted lipase-like protein 3 n=1 Tax=Colletotrichum chlorophyti TaxID=708187 RepID=A0A1Q8S905_9PEZI|nr:putative secreted lipase-like protein 3 [Colletotrichum chlorophyti]
MLFFKVAAVAAALLGQSSALPPAFGEPDALPDVKGGCVDSETPHIRSYFYVGGGYVDDGAGGHIFRDQMYVEKLLPVGGVSQETPIVLIHGQAQTGSNFLNKPDGGRGWASHFVRQGFEVYIVDQTFRGRSAWMPGYGASKPSTYSAEIIQQRFTAVQDYNLWPQASKHTQWPGTGVMGDPVFDAFYSSNVQFINNATYQQTTVRDAGAALLDKIGRPAVVLGHSQGGLMPIVIADARPELTKALILLEPTGPPFQEAVFSNKSSRPYGLTDIPVVYSPEVADPAVDLVQQTFAAKSEDHVACVLQAEDPAPRQLVNLVSKPILLVTAEASYHMPYDYCTVQFLQQAGCSKTEHLELGEVGIHGNGHMFFMEKNSYEIQKVLRDWILNL